MISDCCSAYDNDMLLEMGICPDCKEHCDFVDENAEICECGQERTALGGDVHCISDCDNFAHDTPDGCHKFKLNE